MDQRITDLETKVAFQDDLIHSLSDTVYQQQKQIENLTRKLERLTDQIKHTQPNIGNPADEPPPPHY
ncbi:SlyX family protein [Hahella ganghwensis]|uniref:SlyX family protein n=1 Tax=Hahella ganghwensis TaxID=286420 RepID=UPI0003AAE1EB|nr:SlyX family protein [Hahella ganghwensis]